ncbi:MAG: hypothetical protein R3F59_28730 [Myxococcota bacterium]
MRQPALRHAERTTGGATPLGRVHRHGTDAAAVEPAGAGADWYRPRCQSANRDVDRCVQCGGHPASKPMPPPERTRTPRPAPRAARPPSDGRWLRRLGCPRVHPRPCWPSSPASRSAAAPRCSSLT